MKAEELLRLSNKELRVDEYAFIVHPLSNEDGGGYLIEYPDLPGCMSDGETSEEAVQNGKDALRGTLLTLMEFGDPIPEPGSHVPVALPVGLRNRFRRVAERRHMETERAPSRQRRFRNGIRSARKVASATHTRRKRTSAEFSLQKLLSSKDHVTPGAMGIGENWNRIASIDGGNNNSTNHGLVPLAGNYSNGQPGTNAYGW